MARVVAAIEQYAAEVLAEQTMHPRCGGSTVCVTTIHGGRGTNTVPDVATIDVDRRLQPGEDGERAYHELIDYLATNVDLGAATITHDSPWMLSAGLVDRHNLTWAEQVAETARACGNETRLVGVPYGTNASVISAAGIPTVVFGPGSIAQAHTADEWIAVDQLSRAAEVFYRLASI
jgi:acetylornithine deacetylase